MIPETTLNIPLSVDRKEFFRDNVASIDADSEETAAYLFPDGWIHSHTGYPSFLAFVDDGFDEYDTVSDIPDEEMDEWVAEQSSFDGWEDMLEAATRRWIEAEFTT